MLRYALARCLEIIGEAAGQITLETQAAAPEIPWSQIIGMRHRLAHAYFAINLDYLWDTVAVDLQPLVQEVDRILTRIGDEEPS